MADTVSTRQRKASRKASRGVVDENDTMVLSRFEEVDRWVWVWRDDGVERGYCDECKRVIYPSRGASVNSIRWENVNIVKSQGAILSETTHPDPILPRLNDKYYN